MYVLVVGAGRVGSTVAKRLLAQGNTVSVLDEDPLSHERLDVGETEAWEDRGGLFTVGTALEIEALEEAGIAEADVFVATVGGDNTNLVISQIAQKRFGVDRVVARIKDPGRADWYSNRGLEIVSPTQTAIEMVERAALGQG